MLYILVERRMSVVSSSKLGTGNSKGLYGIVVLQRYVLSRNFYQSIPNEFKTELFPSPIKIRAANGTFIPNKCECDISFTIGSEKFTFQFLCSDQLSQDITVGHNFAHVFHIGTTWSAEDVMSLTYNGKHLVDVLPSKDINAPCVLC